MKIEDKKVWIALIVMGIVALIGIGFTIYVYATYGGKPISEIPAWVYHSLQGEIKNE